MTPSSPEPSAGTANGPGRPKAVVLLSGGLDSATCLAIVNADGFAAHALTVRYGQRHEAEIEAARRIAAAAGAAGHDVVDVDLTRFGGSALTGGGGVPKDRSEAEIGAGIPVTYVPARNTVLLALALARAETLGARDIVVGVNALDYSGYPDCRPEFVAAFEALANLATRAGVEARSPSPSRDEAGGGRGFRVLAPLIDMTKAEIIERGAELGVDFAATLSCYDPVIALGGDPAAGPDAPPLHCGRCDACLLRKKGFAGAGVADPTAYAA